jgi:hypothetical protein
MTDVYPYPILEFDPAPTAVTDRGTPLAAETALRL